MAWAGIVGGRILPIIWFKPGESVNFQIICRLSNSVVGNEIFNWDPTTEAILEKIHHSINFVKLVMFSDEANFHLYMKGSTHRTLETGPKLIPIRQSKSS